MIKSRKLDDLTGGRFGCWKIIARTENTEQEADTRTTWLIECQKCKGQFKMIARNIRRRLNFPEDCRHCRPKSNVGRHGKPVKTIMGFSIELIEKINERSKR